jgi:hypothetical protein
MDVNINGEHDGIGTATRLMQIREVPFIWLAAFTGTHYRACQLWQAALCGLEYSTL